VLHLIAAAVFTIFSFLQWNDLDPAIYDHPSRIDALSWALFYALIAGLFVLSLFRVLPRWVLTVAVVFCAIELARTAPGFWENLTAAEAFTLAQSGMSAADPRVELSREFLGALIALAGVGFLAWERKRAA
jgi:hypothetical protein